MKINVKVKPNSEKEAVEKTVNNDYIVHVKAPPKQDKANKATIKLLSEYFDIAKSMVIITKGASSKKKVIEVLE